jgi:hypothetical protein
LRYFSHFYSFSLLFYKHNDTKLVKYFNTLVTDICNNRISDNYVQKNDILPLYILYSQDSFNEIGDPKVMQSGGKDMSSLWEDTFYTIYKIKEKNEKERDIEEVNSDKYREPRFDDELTNFERRRGNNNLETQQQTARKKVKQKK